MQGCATAFEGASTISACYLGLLFRCSCAWQVKDGLVFIADRPGQVHLLQWNTIEVCPARVDVLDGMKGLPEGNTGLHTTANSNLQWHTLATVLMAPP